MKYKLYGLLAVLFSAATVLVAVLILHTDDINHNRYLQHKEDSREVYDYAINDSVFSSHLPVVQIYVDEAIPGKTITDEETGRLLGHTVSHSGADRICGELIVKEKETEYVSAVTIHVRGNTSRSFDKSSYSINLTDDNGDNNPLDLLGMGEHHEWVLYGPILDRTLIRNYMFYNIAGQIMDYAPDVRFTELFINDEYQGLYVLCESITSGNSRIRLSIDKKDNTFTGYILRLDRGSENEYKNLDNFSSYSYRTSSTVDCVYPGLSNLNDSLKKSITDDFSYFEKVMYSYDYNDDEYGYKTLIDVDNFVDYFIINELTCNYDAGAFSTYIYKDFDGKFKLCVWDFNNACDNYMEQPISAEGFGLVNRVWFWMLVKDEYFVNKIIDRYVELREGVLSENSLISFIDETVAYLSDAIDRNYGVWGYIFESHDLDNVLFPYDRNPDNYDEALTDLKNFLIKRGNWLDENIESLRQYCASSAAKKYDANAN